MTTSIKDTIKNVFSNRNVLITSFTTPLWNLPLQAWQPYWSLWLMEQFGASIMIVGIISMFQQSEQLLFQLPGGIIADKFGRKKIILFGTGLRVILPIIYLVATTWEHVLLAVIINGAASIYLTAFEAIIADSLPSRQRGAGYGVYRMMQSLPSVFMPVIGGAVMDALGYKKGVMIFSILMIFAVTAAFIIRAKYITETLETENGLEKSEQKSAKVTFSSALEAPRQIWIMIVVASLAGFAMRMTFQLIPVYAKDIIQLTNTEIGIAQTAFMLVSTILMMPIGMLSDRSGRKRIILIAEIFTPLTTWATVFAGSFPQFILIRLTSSVASALGGRNLGIAGGPAWQALIADLVPREKRGRTMGLISTLTGIAGIPASIVGSYFWQSYSPASSFHISLLIGIFAAPIFALFVKEPKKEE